MWKVLTRRGPPPEPEPTLRFPIEVVLLYAVWLTVLVAAKNGRALRNPQRLDQLWLCWPISLTAYLVSTYSLSQYQLHSPERDLHTVVRSIVFALPIAGFGLLLLSEAVTWLFQALGPQRTFAALRHPVMSVHAISFLYYSSEPGTESCRMFDAFDRPLHPLRYVLWTISVSSMCLALYLVVEGEEQRAHRKTGEARALSFGTLRGMLVDALLGCYGTFVLGFLGSRVRLGCSTLPNFGFFTLSSLCFYMMLHRLTSMLSHVCRNKLVVQAGTAQQFAAIRIAVIVVWHIFPFVWLLGATQYITAFEEHVGYVLCDLCAKYLLLFVYIGNINV